MAGAEGLAVVPKPAVDAAAGANADDAFGIAGGELGVLAILSIGVGAAVVAGRPIPAIGATGGAAGGDHALGVADGSFGVLAVSGRAIAADGGAVLPKVTRRAFRAVPAFSARTAAGVVMSAGFGIVGLAMLGAFVRNRAGFAAIGAEITVFALRIAFRIGAAGYDEAVRLAASRSFRMRAVGDRMALGCDRCVFASRAAGNIVGILVARSAGRAGCDRHAAFAFFVDGFGAGDSLIGRAVAGTSVTLGCHHIFAGVVANGAVVTLGAG